MRTEQLPQLAAITAAERRAQLASKGQNVLRLRAVVRDQTEMLRDIVTRAAAEGISELEISKLTGITRVTVRGWLGK